MKTTLEKLLDLLMWQNKSTRNIEAEFLNKIFGEYRVAVCKCLKKVGESIW